MMARRLGEGDAIAARRGQRWSTVLQWHGRSSGRRGASMGLWLNEEEGMVASLVTCQMGWPGGIGDGRATTRLGVGDLARL